MRCRKPLIAQSEQLQSSASIRAGASTSKRTRPQWQPPVCVTSPISRAACDFGRVAIPPSGVRARNSRRRAPQARPRMSIEIWYVLAGILVLAGLAGTILPALPGVPLVFAGMLLAAWAGGFESISIATVVVLGVLTALAVAADFVATLLGAKGFGASKWALIGAAI